MNPVRTRDLKKVLEAVHYRPAVSIVLAFDPKMAAKEELSETLKNTCDQVEKSLLRQYPPELALFLLQRLKNIFRQLNFGTHKRSIAIFLSPVFEKLLYLDMEVVPTIIIDDSFEIRDLVACKKIPRQLLLFQLTAQRLNVYLGEPGKYTRILSTPSDLSHPAGTVQLNQTLAQLISSYRLPVFIGGAAPILEVCAALITVPHSIIDFLLLPETEPDTALLDDLFQPYYQNWSSLQQTLVLHRLSAAEEVQRLTIGMSEVWKEAMHHNGKLLVVERDFYFDGFQPHNPYSYVKDAVDDIIEKVLEAGGEVEFVDPGKLTDFGSIALVRFY
ncbi:hypothetical protein [Flavihumibacter sp. CACIAM 22H1]|uniref:hypothetical protein n=1 Tax=Flavihumibacter sp. CACIAM 22H1 TaxID=1812911 RepID=UPI0007A8A64A|nr:hypothetical protein [Flavihumibacter sp. CACIAM 22H1]KYP14542.1 MAG: hypothetical protein A1D16_00185 [Flavihumibacter sp. CACIAM 22H1]